MPDQKRRVSEEHALRILRAVDGLAAAKVERDAAMVAALKAGASLREVAAAADMSVSATQAIAKVGGWPDAAEKRRRAAEEAERHRWDQLIAQARLERGDS